MLQPVRVEMPRDGGESLTFRSYRIPGADDDTGFDLLSEVTVAGQQLDEVWDGSAYALDVPVAPNATHVAVTAAELAASRVQPRVDEWTTIAFDFAGGDTELVVTGTARSSADNLCWFNRGAPIPFTIEALAGTGTSWWTADRQLVVPNADGTFEFRTWLSSWQLAELSLYLQSEGLWWVRDGYAYAEADLSTWTPGQPIHVEVDLVAACPIFG